MATSVRNRISDPVVKRLYALSGNQCAFPKCSKSITYQEAAGEKPVSTGQQAHIVGVGKQGPRSKADPISTDIDAVENLVLLCGDHHTIVDNYPRIYSVEVLAKMKADHERRMAPADLQVPKPTLAVESLDLSLLPVDSLPGDVWSADALFRTAAEVGSHLPRARDDQQVLPFVLNGGKVWAFHDLAEQRGPFSRVVNRKSSKKQSARSLLSSDNRSLYVWLLNSALRTALVKRGVRYDKSHDRYYFLPDHETITRRVAAKTKTGKNQSAKRVVRQEGEVSGNRRDVWWHLAAQLRFEEFASEGSWGLTIRPEFHLTTDGKLHLTLGVPEPG